MNDLFKKLNVLIKSSVNDAVRGVVNPDESSPRRQTRLDKNIDVEIEGLRERINDAVRYEEGMKARIQQYADEAARWDSQADEAVANGNEASARYEIERMKRAEQRAATVEGDLRAHQRATEELIQRVNMLDAVVADVRRAQAGGTPAQEPANQVPANIQLPDLSNVLREAREKIASLGELAAAQRDLATPEQTTSEGDEAAIDDDLDQRRQRLSKR
jgi:phage shock protein A